MKRWMRVLRRGVGVILLILVNACALVIGPVQPRSKNETNRHARVPPALSESRQTSERADAEAVVAEVNGERISRGDFERAFQGFLDQQKAGGNEQPSREAFLDQMINETLILQYARKQGVDREPDYQQELKERQRELLLDYFEQHHLFDGITIGSEEIRQYYERHAEDFMQPEKIQVRHILTNTYEEAAAALQRIKNGEDFQEVARTVSIHASRTQGGALPPFSRGTYNKPFEDAAFALAVGELSGIIKSELGYHIIEKTGETPKQLRPLSDVQQQIASYLLEQKKQQIVQEFLESLRSQAHIRIVEEP
jgi:peptidyl-prolyl cis-trans isomerase C